MSLTYENCIDWLKSVDTPTLANGVEMLRVRPNHEGFTPADIRCIFPEFGRLCGYAVTAHVETISQTGPCDMREFIRLYEAVEASPKPAVIVFQEIGDRPEYAAHCGEVMGTIFTRLGAEGLITDSAVRDIPEVRALGFRYFARGTVASHAHFRIVRVGVTVQVRGMVVNPGDILHGDENGVLTIPREGLNKLRAHVDDVRSREGELLEYVRSADFTLEGLHGRIVE
jgi:4-hydroxy-4-methyl-2-oxoglutarate aldolase